MVELLFPLFFYISFLGMGLIFCYTEVKGVREKKLVRPGRHYWFLKKYRYATGNAAVFLSSFYILIGVILTITSSVQLPALLIL